MNSRSTVLCALAAACVAGGCRSDGGFDRFDSGSDFRFAARSVVERTREDAATTWREIRAAPEAFVRSFGESASSMRETYHLYVENNSSK